MNTATHNPPAAIMPAGTPETIRSAVRALRDGGVVAVPTDTVFGLVCLFDNDVAIKRIFEIKGRPETKPLPLLLGTAVELSLVADDIPSSAWPLIYTHWPGPLTIIFQAKRSVSRLVTAGTNTVGTRVPAHPAVLDLLEAVGLPLASTSANTSGRAPALTAEGVFAQTGPRVDLIVDSGAHSPGGVISTVVDLTCQPALIRRKGAVSLAQVREALGARVDVESGG
jgi:L-threonylcarbamoyladenylate synthase